MLNQCFSNSNKSAGFTLVELMITIAVSLILSAAVYAAYTVQQRTASAQSQVTEIQQNIRVAFYFLTKDLKMAGFDPTSSDSAGITTAKAGRIAFTMDITDNPGTGDSDGDVGDTGESITFGFNSDPATDNGIPNTSTGVDSFRMDTGGGYQPIAENIERIQFFYTLDDGTTTLTPTTAQLDDIISVTVSILARAGDSDHNYTNTQTYILGDGTNIVVNDNFRRRLLVSKVACRNLVM